MSVESQGHREQPDVDDGDHKEPPASQHHSLKYHLLGPSLLKSGQEGVDQSKVSEIIYEASKGSKYFDNEEVKDKNLTEKINCILAKRRELQRVESQGGLKQELKKADECIAKLECGRDLTQVIVHVDCDAFYAAVEELDRPELKDVPFAVGKGVLTTCNYVARQYGCRSGMAGFVADKLCPQLIHLPLNFDKYTAKAKEVRAVLGRYDPQFESASIDEAYLNITDHCKRRDMDPADVVSEMRVQVQQESKITVSAGIAANAKLAKICSNKNKPNGQFRLPADRATILSFMRDLPTRKVNGIGRVLERELDAIGIKTCGEIYPQRHYIRRLLGEKTFEFLIEVFLGLGRTDIRPPEDHERKSVGTESTFHETDDRSELRKKLRWIAAELEKDLQRTQFKGRTLVLKIKLDTYEVFTRQLQPPKAINTADDLFRYGLAMLTKLEKEIPRMTLRLMGLRCTQLIDTKKGDYDFFGSVRRKPSLPDDACERSTAAVEIDADGWQVWRDEEFEDAARQEREDESAELNRLSQDAIPRSDGNADLEADDPDYRRYGNGFAWRSVLEEEQAKAEEERRQETPLMAKWACPICSMPQCADEKSFNDHIDGCLSRQTIKEMVRTRDESLGKRGGIDEDASSRKRVRHSHGGSLATDDGKKLKKSWFT